VAASFDFTGSVRLVPTWTEPLDLVDVVDKTTISQALSLDDGTAAGEADCYWRDTRTLAAGGTDTLDLSSLPLNVYGGTDTLDIGTLRVVYVRNKSATVALQYSVGSETMTITPGGLFVWYGTTTFTASPTSAAQEIVIENDGASAVDYDIVLVGVQT
jgi:hypothetical protein